MVNLLEKYNEYFKYLLSKKDIIKDDKYMKWLESVTNNGAVKFTQGDETIEKKDLLKNFYDEIYSYFKKNNLTIYEDGLEYYYYVKYNDVIYKIGVIYDLNSTYYCERVEDIQNINYISFEDIVNNKYVQSELDDETFRLIKALKENDEEMKRVRGK